MLVMALVGAKLDDMNEWVILTLLEHFVGGLGIFLGGNSRNNILYAHWPRCDQSTKTKTNGGNNQPCSVQWAHKQRSAVGVHNHWPSGSFRVDVDGGEAKNEDKRERNRRVHRI